MKTIKVSIIGGGPAGLMAAETLAKAGIYVTVYERKASVGRKFLMAGRGGLNLTHSEEIEKFKRRYNEAEPFLSPLIDEFTPQHLRNWVGGLGENTFVGSSGRIFPESFKASPMLRAWIKRLDGLGVHFRLEKNWQGWNENGDLIFTTNSQAARTDHPDYTILALGGASWPNLGSDGSWVQILREQNIEISDLEPANCGFELKWSDVFRNKCSGQPLKNIALSFDGKTVPGEIIISEKGIEGGAIYALSSRLRKSLKAEKDTVFNIDLRPTFEISDIIQKLQQPKNGKSFSSWLERVLNLSSLEINLLREVDLKVTDYSPEQLSTLIKAVPIRVRTTYPIEKAISSAGGIKLNEIDQNLMLKKLPGVFVAGEMIDWEAPTGGYLLQACFSTGRAAALGLINYAKTS